MSKVEAIIKSEVVRLAKREIRKISVPLVKDVRLLKSTVSQLRKAVLVLERVSARQNTETLREKTQLQANPEEVKISRFSPRLIQALRKRLRITQKEMAVLAGVTVGAIYQWEKGIFEPRGQKKGILVALRKLGRRDVKKLLEEKKNERVEKKIRVAKGKGRRKLFKR
jgi:DNA-binding transcriptional regulator YiaG